MKSIWLLKTMYFQKRTRFYPREITIRKKSMYQQTAANCWIFWPLNNLYLNTGIVVDPEEIIEKIQFYWLNTTTIWNDDKYSAVIICDFLKDKKLKYYEIDVLKDTKLFARMLMAWYSFTYTRDCHNNVLQDIKDNNQIDDVIISKWSRHCVNLCFVQKKLKEYGSRWDYNIYNNFVYSTINVFIKSVQAWAIVSTVRFIDYQQK